MPVTDTAKRALRSSKKKRAVNNRVRARLETSIRKAKKEETPASVKKAVSAVDKAVKKGVIHKNKAARIKSRLSKIARTTAKKKKKKSKKSSEKGKKGKKK